MLNMACTLVRLTPEEALAGVTRHAARALALHEAHGALGVGRPASFVLWNVESPADFAYWLGSRPVRAIVRRGRIATPA
jgi:imidazolonepropionase